MPLLSTSEALHVSDSFLSSLYGDVIFRRWKELKDEMKFVTEREYVSWLIDVANYYKGYQDESEQLPYESGMEDSTVQSRPTNREGHLNISQQGQEDRSRVSKYSTLGRTNKRCDFHLKTEEIIKSEPPTSEEFYNDKSLSVPYQAQPGPSTSTECKIKTEPNDVNVQLSQTDNLQYRQTDMLGSSQFVQQEQVHRSDEDTLYNDYYYTEDDAAAGVQNMPQHDDIEEIIVSSGDEDDSAAAYNVENIPVVNMEGKHNTKVYKCPHCQYRSHHKAGDVKRHIKTIHELSKPFACNHCYYKSADKSTLKQHLISKHGYKSKYCCEICGRYFTKANLLMKHEQSCKP